MAKKPARKKVKKPARKRGRPNIYSDALADRICHLIATGSKGIHTLCEENKDLPDYSTVFKWLLDSEKYAYLFHQYARAKELQADYMADEMTQLADKVRVGNKTVSKIGGKNGDVIEHHTVDMVERSKLQIETRKWLASKLKAKKYGNKLDLTSDNKQIQQVDLGAMISKFMGNEGDTEAAPGT